MLLASFSGTAPASRAARQEAAGGSAPQAPRGPRPRCPQPATQGRGRLVVSASVAEVRRALSAHPLLAQHPATPANGAPPAAWLPCRTRCSLHPAVPGPRRPCLLALGAQALRLHHVERQALAGGAAHPAPPAPLLRALRLLCVAASARCCRGWHGGLLESKNRRLPLQTCVADVAKDTITIRCLDWDRDRRGALPLLSLGANLMWRLGQSSLIGKAVHIAKTAGTAKLMPLLSKLLYYISFKRKHQAGCCCRRFDIEFGLSDGTTYNSYLIFGAEKTALVETSHEKFRRAQRCAPQPWCLVRALQVALGPPCRKGLACLGPCFLRPGQAEAETQHNRIPATTPAPLLYSAPTYLSRESYIPVVQEQLAKAGRTLDYIICSHTEPDHSGGWPFCHPRTG